MGMKILGHDLFAGAGLAGDQYRNIVHSVTVGEVKHFMKLRRVADHLPARQWSGDRRFRDGFCSTGQASVKRLDMAGIVADQRHVIGVLSKLFGQFIPARTWHSAKSANTYFQLLGGNAASIRLASSMERLM